MLMLFVMEVGSEGRIVCTQGIIQMLVEYDAYIFRSLL